ncbi:MAG: FkbM family methyltransferase [Candidatus Jordarchaeaceae archaeon]
MFDEGTRLLRRVIETYKSDGFKCFSKRAVYTLFKRGAYFRTRRLNLNGQVSRKIDLSLLGLNCGGELFVNPYDVGFSREFFLYGFREPLNTIVLYKTIKKKKPIVLDIGSNIGYFPIIELEAGAKHVIAVEPVPSAYMYLSKNLSRYKNVTMLNIAISDKEEDLTLYMTNALNNTSASRHILVEAGLKIVKELTVKAASVSKISEQYPIEMLRMDVEGHEYKILSNTIPDTVETISIELHIIPPYRRTDAARLFNHLDEQGFQATYVITEMKYGFYPFIKLLGLRRTYSYGNRLIEGNLEGPNIRKNVDLKQLTKELQERCLLHLNLER